MAQSTLSPEIIALRAEVLKLVAIIRLGLEPNNDDLRAALKAARCFQPSRAASA